MSRDQEFGLRSVALDRRGAVRLISAVALGLGARIGGVPASAAGGIDGSLPADGCDDVTGPGEPGADPAPADPASLDSYGGDSYDASGEDGDVPDGGDTYGDECGDGETMPISAPRPDFGDERGKGKRRRKGRKRKNGRGKRR